MAKRDIWSPSRFNKYKNPIAGVVDSYFSKDTHSSINASNLRVGSEIHEAISSGFDWLSKRRSEFPKNEFLNGSYNPSNKVVQKILNDSFNVAKNSLRLHQSIHHKRFVNYVINKYGDEYLRNPDMDIKVDSQLEGVDPLGNKLYGKLDLDIRKTKDRTRKIVELKNAFSEHYLKTFDNASEEMQAKIYPYLALQEEAKGQGFNVSMEYLVNVPWEKTPRIIPIENPAKDIDKLGFLIAEEVARVESINQIVYDRKKTTRSTKELKANVVSDIIKQYGCNPSMCSSCPIQFSCKDKFVSDLLEHNKVRESYLSNNSISKWKKKLAWSIRKDQDPIFQGKLYTQDMQRALENIDTARAWNGVPANQIDSEMAMVRESWEAAKYLKRGSFEDEITKHKLSAVNKVPFSIIEREFKNTWLSKRVANRIDYQARGLISNIADSFDIRHEVIEDEVMGRVFQDQHFVNQIYEYGQATVADELGKAGLHLNRENINHVLRRPDKLINKNMAVAITDKIAYETINTIHQLDSNAIYDKLGPREKFKESGISGMFGHAVDTGLIKTDAELFLNGVARTETVAGLRQRFRLSPSKLPFSSIAKAVILGYLAGTDTIQRIIARKTEKATENVVRSQDDTVNTGEHYSTYTTARRFLMSDFGSKRRSGNPISMLTAKVMTGFGKRSRQITDETISSTAREKIAGLFHFPIDDLKLLRKPASVMAIAAAVGFTVSGILPHIKTSRDIGKDTEIRKQRFKDIKKIRPGQRSGVIQEPESELRKGYKAHTPFGSPIYTANWAIRLLEEFPLSKIPKLLEGWDLGRIASKIKMGTQGKLTQLIELVAKTKPKILSSELATDPKGMIHRKAREAAGKIDESEQWLREKHIGKLAINKTQDIAERADKFLRGQDLNSVINHTPDILSTAMTTKRPAGGGAKQPVIVEPDRSAHPQHVLTFDHESKKIKKRIVSSHKGKQVHESNKVPDAEIYRGAELDKNSDINDITQHGYNEPSKPVHVDTTSVSRYVKEPKAEKRLFFDSSRPAPGKVPALLPKIMQPKEIISPQVLPWNRITGYNNEVMQALNTLNLTGFKQNNKKPMYGGCRFSEQYRYR